MGSWENRRPTANSDPMRGPRKPGAGSEAPDAQASEWSEAIREQCLLTMVGAAQPWQQSLTADELHAIGGYTVGTGVLSANRKLRGRDAVELDDLERHLVATLEAALNRSRIDQPLVLYRVVGHHLKSEIDQVPIGGIWPDPGFVSCSIHRERDLERDADRDVLDIYAPAGALGGYVANLTPQDGEEAHGEVILARGLRFRVRVRFRQSGRVVASLEALPAISG